MKVEQIKDLVNQTTKEIIGETTLLTDDLSNVVDMGETITSLNQIQKDNYLRTLIDKIGKTVFVDRKYQGSVPSVLKDGWEFGAILEKISMKSLPSAEDNDSWLLEDGTSYDPNVFRKPKAEAKFFNSKNSFQIQMSFADKQVRSAFKDQASLNAFLTMIQNNIDNSMTLKTDSMIMNTINNMTANVLHKNVGNTSVNLLKMYNEEYNKTLTAKQAVVDPDFIRYASFIMSLYETRMSKLSKLFNVSKAERFTPNDKLHIVMLSDFKKAADVFLQSNVRHNELTKLPNAEEVAYWQGSGLNYEFEATSKINVKIKDVEDPIEKAGILAVMFDDDALGVTNENKRITTQYNPRAEFYNNWYKFDCSYFNDLNENFVVFYVED